MAQDHAAGANSGAFFDKSAGQNDSSCAKKTEGLCFGGTAHDGARREMDMISHDALVFYDGAGVYDAVAANDGAGIDDSAGHHYCSGAYFGGGRNDS